MCPSEPSIPSSGGTGPQPNAAPSVADKIDPYVKATIAEIRLLLDHIGGQAKSPIGDLKLPRPACWQPARCASGDAQNGLLPLAENPIVQPGPGAEILANDILAKFAEIATNADDGKAINAFDIAFVILLRDKLNVVASPATGMTVAYTWMVTGTSWGPKSLRPLLAEQAYPALVRKARWHRSFSYAFIVLAIFVTAFAVWEATKVALGKSLLASLQELRLQQVSLNTEKMKLLASSDSTKQFGSATLPGSQFSLRPCENASYRFFALPPAERKSLEDWARWRHNIEQGSSGPQSNDQNFEVLIFGSPAEQDVCDKDRLLAFNFGLLFEELKQYNESWPVLLGRFFELQQDIVNIAIWPIRSISNATVSPGIQENVKLELTVKRNDIEWVIVARLLVLGNYILPVVFAVLGAIAYVMVDYFNKVRGSLLSPRDLGLACIRMVLGFLVGASIGLLYSSSVPVAQAPGAIPSIAGLLNTLTLSASGVAFLAGFGVEGVFSMLEAVIRRVFPTNADTASK